MWFLVFYIHYTLSITNQHSYQVTWSCLSLHIAKSTLLATNNKQYGGVTGSGSGLKFFELVRAVQFQTSPPKVKILDETLVSFILCIGLAKDV